MDGGNQLGGDDPAELVLMGGSNEPNGDGVKARREEKSGDMNGGVKPGGDEPAELAQMGGSNERNGDGRKARIVSSGPGEVGEQSEGMEREEEMEEFEIRGDGASNEETDGEEGEGEGEWEGEEEGEILDQEGEKGDIVESVLREIHAWEGKSKGQPVRQGDIKGRNGRKSTGLRGKRRKEGERSGVRDVRVGVMEARGGASGFPKPVSRGGRARGRRRLVDRWMAGLPENTERTTIEKPSSRRGRRGRRLADGWVGGPWEESTSAFRWVNEVGKQEDMLAFPDSYYQWQWPVQRLGKSWRGMFMRRNTQYDIKNTPSCQGILPKSAYVNAPIWKSDAGVSELKLLSELQRKVENNESIPQDLEDFMLKERWLIWMPRFGLGNSLRAYTSAFIFALLSGRRWQPQAGNFFEKTWRTDPQMNQCVHSAFNCRTIWCIRSKVLSQLLGKGPKPGVEEVVDRDLRVVPPLVLPGIGSKTEEREVQEGTVEPQMVRKGEGLRVQFDVSIHIRGLSINVEGDYCRNREDMSCRERSQQEEMLRVQELMKPTQWRCIARLMQTCNAVPFFPLVKQGVSWRKEGGFSSGGGCRMNGQLMILFLWPPLCHLAAPQPLVLAT
ncbi:unnamed protein product [Closterium sp. Naga37s-1]|nr:unnamed protein product [Closterium sp. Naga37s-1]